VNSEDQQDITDCLAGQTEAFGRLVDRYQTRLYNSLLSIVGSPHEAGDVMQEAFLHAFQKLNTFRGHSAFYSWLFRIAMNAMISMKRKTKRIKASVEATRESTGQEPTDPHLNSQPDHVLEVAEKQVLVRAALQELSEEYRAVLVLKEMEGMKYEEIADVLDCPIGTVRSRIHRARQELREKLRFLFPDSSD